MKGRKILRAIILCWGVLLGNLAGYGFTYLGSQYEVISNEERTARLVQCFATKEEVIIPDTVYGLKDSYIVTVIAENAFSSARGTTELILPRTLKVIEANALSGLAIESIEIPDGVVEIGEGVFKNCKSLTELDLPASVEYIGPQFVSGASSLKAINVAEGNPVYASRDGVLYNKEITEIVKCPEGIEGVVSLPENLTEVPDYAFDCCVKITEIILPEGIVKIGEGAFYCCSGLSVIKLPDTVAEIGKLAFFSCTSLQEIVIPRNVETLGKYAISWCKGLKNVTILSPLKRIEVMTFEQCENLEAITFGEGLEFIGNSAFMNCYVLKSIEFPNSLREIESYAFCGCRSLEEVTIKDNLKSIGSGIFALDTNLTTFNVSPDNPFLFSENGMLITRDGEEIVLRSYPSARGDVVLPECLTCLSGFAFMECRELKSVTIPEKVKSVDYSTFNFCMELDKVVIYAMVPPSEHYIFGDPVWDFSGMPRYLTFYVPEAAYQAYMDSGWRKYGYRISTIEELAGVEAVEGEATPKSYEVYSLDGKLILSTPNRDSVDSLPKGIYIVNGEKRVIR